MKKTKKNIIKIGKKFLVFREDARTIFKKILKQKRVKNFVLDFSQVDFLSRSFVDELLNIKNNLREKNIVLDFFHLKPELAKFINLIQKTKNLIKKERVLIQK